jgi:hypothetical protein
MFPFLMNGKEKPKGIFFVGGCYPDTNLAEAETVWFKRSELRL